MNIPENPALPGPAAFPTPRANTFEAPLGTDPNNPPWKLWGAALAWFASVVFLWLVPQVCALPYIATHYRASGPTKELLLNDKTFVLILVAGFIPAHLLTLLVAWLIASRVGKFSAFKTLGFSWPANFGFWKSTATAVALFLIAMAIIYKFGGQDTDLEKILRSSRAAAIVTAFVAAVTAPLVEEVIYRGLLYSALQRAAGVAAAIAIVALTFAGLHVLQYWPNFGAIAAISLLSLVLTFIRARTGRLLPCYVIHLVFNGIQSVIIVADPFVRSLFQTPHPDAAPALLCLFLKLL